ncbi:MAG: O-antigen ligase family protein [Pseudomonadota bacterium]|nr:O-antigen ligase family protein [Pseudomonadota bacterium]
MARANRINLALPAFWLLALSAAFLPFGFGGNRPLPLGLAQAGFALSSLLMALSRRAWSDVRFFSRLRWALGLFCVTAVWALFQASSYAPGTWVHPLWAETAAVLKTPLRGAIAISPEDSIKGLTDLVTYVAAGFLAYIFAQDVRRARLLLKLFWYSGATMCLYGLLVYFAHMNAILWFPKSAYLEDLTATFVNHNHFAIYAGMIFVCGGALLGKSFEHEVRRKKAHQRVEAFREWFPQKAVPEGFLLAAVLTSIVLSHSRAGLILTILGFGSYVFFYQIYMGAWSRAVAIGASVVASAALTLFAAMHFSDRFSVLFSDYSSLDRMNVYKLAWHALQDNPWLGYGLNGFEPVFRLYQQSMLMEFNHAHSDVLESLVDLGVPAALLLWAGIALLLSGLWHGIRNRRRDGFFPALGLAVSVLALGHALVDFDLQIPGVATTWAVLVGTGLAQSWTHSNRREELENLA